MYGRYTWNDLDTTTHWGKPGREFEPIEGEFSCYYGHCPDAETLCYEKFQETDVPDGWSHSGG